MNSLADRSSLTVGPVDAENLPLRALSTEELLGRARALIDGPGRSTPSSAGGLGGGRSAGGDSALTDKLNRESVIRETVTPIYSEPVETVSSVQAPAATHAVAISPAGLSMQAVADQQVIAGTYDRFSAFGSALGSGDFSGAWFHFNYSAGDAAQAVNRERMYPAPHPDAARLDRMLTSPIGASMWGGMNMLGASPRAQDAMLAGGVAFENSVGGLVGIRTPGRVGGSQAPLASRPRGAGEADNGVPTRLYHYTNEAGVNGIVNSGRLNPSLKALNPNDVRYGNGQYLSDIAPGTMTPAQLSRKFINNPFQGARYTHFVEIDTAGLNIIQGRAGVYVVPNEVPLSLSGRLTNSGKVGP